MTHSRTLLGIVTAFVLSGCGDRVALEDTGISVKVPRGFQQETAVESSWPNLTFRLPPFGANGLQAAYPEIRLSLARSWSIEPKPPEEYLFSKRKDLQDALIFGPVSTTIAGRPAVEVAIRSQIVAMGAGVADVIHHDIEFVHESNYYVCRLTAYPHEYGRYLDDLRNFCQTVQFSNPGSS